MTSSELAKYKPEAKETPRGYVVGRGIVVDASDRRHRLRGLNQAERSAVSELQQLYRDLDTLSRSIIAVPSSAAQVADARRQMQARKDAEDTQRLALIKAEALMLKQAEYKQKADDERQLRRKAEADERAIRKIAATEAKREKQKKLDLIMHTVELLADPNLPQARRAEIERLDALTQEDDEWWELEIWKMYGVLPTYLTDSQWASRANTAWRQGRALILNREAQYKGRGKIVMIERTLRNLIDIDNNVVSNVISQSQEDHPERTGRQKSVHDLAYAELYGWRRALWEYRSQHRKEAMAVEKDYLDALKARFSR